MRRAAVRATFKPLLSWELAVQWRGEQFRTLQPLCVLVLPAMGGEHQACWGARGAAFSPWTEHA